MPIGFLPAEGPGVGRGFGDYDPYRQGLLLPRIFNLELTAIALHEIAGMWWSTWHEEVAAEPDRKG